MASATMAGFLDAAAHYGPTLMETVLLHEPEAYDEIVAEVREYLERMPAF